ncbi:MAG: hypothetical protein KAR39_12800 [Thermoplasmata archaeon]|nr:hypothetical protein [Thermoplasmata archaeon]
MEESAIWVVLAFGTLLAGLGIGAGVHSLVEPPYKEMYRKLRDDTERETPIETAQRHCAFMKDMLDGSITKQTEGQHDVDDYHKRLSEARDSLRKVLAKEIHRLDCDLKLVPGGE